jgi:MscS family membrane protein
MNRSRWGGWWVLAVAAGWLGAVSLAAAAAEAQTDGAPAEQAAAVVAESAAEPSVLEQGLRYAKEVLSLQLGDNPAGRVLFSFLLLLLALVLRKLVVAVVFGSLRRLTVRTANRFGDRVLHAVEKPAAALVLVLGVFLALAVLRLPVELERAVLVAFKVSLLVVVFWAFLRAVDVVADVLSEIAREKGMGIAPFVPLIKKTARVFFVIVGVILVVQNLGYSVGSLLAGLGIGGLAVALAAQDSIANFFGSVVVAADQPLKVGDFVKIGGTMGVVEEIGLRSTRLRTREKTLVTIPNRTLASEPIENFTAITRRRVEQTIGVTYETKPEQMEALLEELRRILREDEGVDQKELQMVRFNGFGSSSLDILTVYHAATANFVEAAAVREQINLKMMRAVLGAGLSFAFPTKTLYLEGEVARRLAARSAGPGG